MMKSETKKRNAEISKVKILDAAEILFADKGYERTSLFDIGIKAGVSRATPTYFFSSKENLYSEVVRRLIKDEREYTSRFEIINRTNFKDALVELIEKHIDFILSRPAYVKILVRESLDENSLILELKEYSALIEIGIEIIEKAKVKRIISNKVDSKAVLMNSLALTWFPILQGRLVLETLDCDIRNINFNKAHKRNVINIMFSELG